MSDESHLQVTPTSSLSLSKARTSLAARGRRDAAILAGGSAAQKPTNILWEIRRLAEAGDRDAQFRLGLMYDEGFEVPQDFAEAAGWYRKAAEQGHAQAQCSLGDTYYAREDYAEATPWYRKAAEQGHAQAQYSLGAAYRLGDGVAQSDAEAAKWFRKAAEQGHANAQNDLSVMHRDGRSLPQ